MALVEGGGLYDLAMRYRWDPYRFVVGIYPWGEGELRDHLGPRDWQREVLEEVGESLRDGSRRHRVIRVAVASGHGIGKGALSSWLVHWGMSTMVDCRSVLTANTENQLRTKTWPEVAKWHRLSLNRDWFQCTATALFSSDRDRQKTWRADAIPWSEEKPEAFAGLHNQGRRILLIFDEASAIPDKIWEVSEGALTDESTEIIWVVLGNPTRNTGKFRQCFGRSRHRWSVRNVDARSVEGTSKDQFRQWVEDYGEDSDFVRVRVRGLFPRASSLQYLGHDEVGEAMKREARCLLDDSLVVALDISRGGEDNCVFYFRRGLDGRTIAPVVIPGSEARDSMRVVAKALEIIEEHRPDAMFVDATGIGGPVADRLRQLGHPCIDVQFGARSPDRKFANMREYMWSKMKVWIRGGGAIVSDPRLEEELCSIEYKHNKRDQLVLESKDELKRRGLASPDMADALAMTFAYPVKKKYGVWGQRIKEKARFAKHEYDPLAPEFME